MKKGELVGVQAFQCGLLHDGLTARDCANRVANKWRQRGKSARVYYRSISVDTVQVSFEVLVVREKLSKPREDK